MRKEGGGSARKGLPGPVRFSNAEVIAFPHDPDFGLLHDTSQKRLLICNTLVEFFPRQNSGVYGATKHHARILQRREKLPVAEFVTDQHQVNVAARSIRLLGNGTIDKSGDRKSTRLNSSH